MTTPIAKKIPTVIINHGITNEDNYALLRNKESDPDVLHYLQAENEHTNQFMNSTKELQEQLFQEITQKIQLSDTSVPYRWRQYFYYFRSEQEKEYRVFCRRSCQHLE